MPQQPQKPHTTSSFPLKMSSKAPKNKKSFRTASYDNKPGQSSGAQSPAERAQKFLDRYNQCISGKAIGKDNPLTSNERKLNQCLVVTSNADKENGMTIVNKSVEETIKYGKQGQADVAAVNSILSQFQAPEVKEEDLSDRLSKHTRGLNFIGVGIKDNPCLTIFSEQFGALPQDSPLHPLLQDLNSDMRLTILRNRNDEAFEKKIYPDFEPFEQKTIPDPKDDTKTIEKEALLCWFDGDLPVPTLPWMKMPDNTIAQKVDADGEVIPAEQRYGSLPVEQYFASTEDYHLYMTIFMVKDHYHQEAMIEKVFNWVNLHRAKAVEKEKGNGWSLRIKVPNIPGVSTPKVPDTTRFTVQFAYVDMEKRVTDQFQGVVAEVETKRSCFVLEFYTLKDDVIAWQDGGEFEVRLIMHTNPEPAKTQFAALQKIADLPNNRIVQLVLGYNFDACKYTTTPLADKLQNIPETDALELLNILNAAKLNPLQFKAFNSVFLGTKGASFLQGPPGTGKSHLIAMVAICANVL
ncbi:hypothetical protein G7Y89_g14510 [Cudoniella acicularis]|uniref:DNA2/NAM7 helicase helicase domain-containing protein n=1 Tax=Cudoniella acicularis TaxID=354080 RepID=A0A8H4R3H7_9HELO|nr:hypothetical protein G7Y89_g14510 [Cudoniella acicularis]